MRLNWPKSEEGQEARFPKLGVFVGQKVIFRHYCIQNFKDGIQIRICKINNEIVIHFTQCVSVKVKRILRKPQAQFRGKSRKSRLRQSDRFLIKNRVMSS